jgi:hypothetical protein
MQLTRTDDGLVEVVFKWSDKYGDCEDCGAPAAYVSDRYGAPDPVAKDGRLCPVCAAEDAANGHAVVRLDDDEAEAPPESGESYDHVYEDEGYDPDPVLLDWFDGLPEDEVDLLMRWLFLNQPSVMYDAKNYYRRKTANSASA